MTERSSPHAEELEAALEDVRRIRSLLNEMSEQNPVRVVMLPLFRLGWVFAPLLFFFGVLAQWVLDAPAAGLWGMSKPILYASLVAAVALTGTVLKSWVIWSEGRRHGIDFFSAIRGIVTTGYLRIILPIVVGMTFVGVLLANHGEANHIAGLFVIAYGMILTAMPLAIPVPEMNGLGWVLLLLGGLSFFVWPAFPFYKIAVLMGGACAWMGFCGRRSTAPDTG